MRRVVSDVRVSTLSAFTRRISVGGGAGLRWMPTAGRHVGAPYRPRHHRRSVSGPVLVVSPDQCHRPGRHQWRSTSTQCDRPLMYAVHAKGQTLVAIPRAHRVHLVRHHPHPQATQKATLNAVARTEINRSSISQRTRCTTNWPTAPSSRSPV